MRRMTGFALLCVFLIGASPVWGQTIADLEARIEVLEAALVKLACITTQGSGDVPDIVFQGCNVHVRNGQGSTQTTNGKGNLIVGYNEEGSSSKERGGSHNLVIGNLHEYTRYGGLVAGVFNRINVRSL